jgi:hypothetical protein
MGRRHVIGVEFDFGRHLLLDDEHLAPKREAKIAKRGEDRDG